MTYRCDYCESDCNSYSEYIACVERCELDDDNTRSWFARYNPHRKN